MQYKNKPIKSTNKYCPLCKRNKPKKEFHKNARKPGGINYICKVCNCRKARAWHKANPKRAKEQKLLRAYGLTFNDYTELVKLYKNRCAICNAHRNKFARKLAVDHDHITKHVRGILCVRCNKALGLFYDEVSRLKQAIRYLQAFKNAVKEYDAKIK